MLQVSAERTALERNAAWTLSGVAEGRQVRRWASEMRAQLEGLESALQGLSPEGAAAVEPGALLESYVAGGELQLPGGWWASRDRAAGACCTQVLLAGIVQCQHGQCVIRLTAGFSPSAESAVREAVGKLASTMVHEWASQRDAAQASGVQHRRMTEF